MNFAGAQTNAMSARNLLIEYYKHMKPILGYSPLNAKRFNEWTSNPTYFNEMKNFFKDRFATTDVQKKKIDTMLNNSKMLLEWKMSTGGFGFYDVYAFPVLMNAYPKIVAPLCATEITMESNNLVKSFMKVYFTPSGSSEKLEGPVYSTSISGGRKIDITVAANNSLTDLLANAEHSPLTSDQATIERGTVVIYAASFDGGTTFVPCSLTANHRGEFGGEEVRNPDESNTAINYAFIIGGVDYGKGILKLASVAPSGGTEITHVKVRAKASLEYNAVNPTIHIEDEQIEINPQLRQVTASFTVPQAQDMASMYKIDTSAKVMAASAEQVALDIDIDYFEQVRQAIDEAALYGHVGNFSFRKPAGLTAITNRQYHEDILVELGVLGGTIRDNAKLAQAENVLVCNSKVGTLYHSMMEYKVTRTEAGGAVGFTQGTAGGGAYTTIESPIIDDNEMFFILKGSNEEDVVSYLANYVSGMTVSYPNKDIPTVTFMRRSENKIVRRTGFGKIVISSLRSISE